MSRGHFSGRYSSAALALALLQGTVAHAATGTAASRSQIRKQITLANVTDLNFGTIIRGAAAGTVTINARTGARTSAGGVTQVGTTGFTTANFNGTGSAGRVVTVSAGAASFTITNGTGGTMTVNTLRTSGNGSAAQTLPRNYTLPASGALALRIGGRLNVAANQADGNYSGTFTINMDYQ
jgi:Mat/Ecp fimbriae major subunit